MAGDLKFALRSLRNSPGFTAIALLTLALGVGASTAIFSIVENVVLQPLGFDDPERLVRVSHDAPEDRSTITRGAFSPPDFEEKRS